MWTLNENPNCEATHASFRLVGDALIPDAIERDTGLTGDFAAAKGKRRNPRTGREVAQVNGVWLISSDGHVTSTSLERHIVYLLETVEPVKEKLLMVAQAQGAAADFYCYWLSAHGQGGPGLSAETLCRIGALDATLAFDLYFADED